MFGIIRRIKVGLALARSSGRVLVQHPKLVVLPVLSSISAIAYMLGLFGGLLGASMLVESDLVVIGVLFLFYAGTTFIASYFNAALVYCAARAFNGQEPRIREGVAAAWEKKRLLAAWAVVAAVIGLVLRAIEETSDILGKIVAFVIGAAWALMTFFVVPVIVFEDVSVRGMFSRSTGLIRETWGESFAAMGAIGVIYAVVMIPALFAGILLPTGALAAVSPTAGIISGMIGIVLFAVVGYFVATTLGTIAKAGLYVYASQDVLPSEFENARSALE